MHLYFNLIQKFMKKIMNLKSLLLLILAGVFLMSCNEDEDDNTPEDVITYDGVSYAMKDGVIYDYGAATPYIVPTHYNYDFVITDASLVKKTESDGDTYWSIGDETTFGVYIELYSPGTSSFKTGTFEYLEWHDDVTQADFDGKYFFSDAEVILISNNTEIEYEATGGTVKVLGSGLEYTLDFDLVLNNGKTLKGNYSGLFKYEGERGSAK